MADFKTHITVSTAVGIGYGAVAHTQFGIPWPTCVMAGTLCSVSGMLPDLDSDSGVPLRESLSFAAACVPMLCLERFRHLGWPPESIALAGAGIYLAIRFGVGKMLKKYTVHRGMFHSIPAAIIAGECAFLICSYGDIYIRAYKACAVVAGFLSHLILDEIWSVKVTGGRIGLKSSSGTAMKLWGDDAWANLSCYGKMILLAVVVLNDPIWTTVSPQGEELHTIASRIFGEAKKVVPQNFANNLENKLAERLTYSGGTANQSPPTYPQQPQYPAQANYNAPPQYSQAQYSQPQYSQQPYAQSPIAGQQQYASPQQSYTPSPNYAAPQQPAYANPYSSAPAGYSAPMSAPYVPPSAPATYTPPQQPPSYYYAPQSGQTYQYVPNPRY